MEYCFENLEIQIEKKDHSCFGFYFVFHLKEKVSWVSYLMGMALELFDLWGNIPPHTPFLVTVSSGESTTVSQTSLIEI